MTDPLPQFARQLAAWARGHLETGRSPFRRVETHPRLLTCEGQQRPDLVFWINRQSHMAGGVVLLPRQRAEEMHARGLACARALGLRHFVTWAPREIAIWEDRGPGAHRLRLVPFTGAESPTEEDFQEAVLRLMDELKTLAVLGAVPAAELTPHNLANLCAGSLRGATPLLEEAFRVALGEGRLVDEGQGPSALARAKAAVTLFRLLALAAHDRLAPTVQPERLERAMELALPGLPSPLARILSRDDRELPLPEAAAVQFHHLYRRLTQVGWHSDLRRAAASTNLLLSAEGRALGGAPLPPPRGETQGPLLLVRPDHPAPTGPLFHELAPHPLLAGFALLRDLRGELFPEGAEDDPFRLTPPPGGFTQITGTLAGTSPSADLTRRLAALRVSWPNRRFHLPPETPAWVYELIHLLGLTAPRGTVNLHLPGDWPARGFGKAITQLLQEQFGEIRIAPSGEHLHLEAMRENSGHGTIEIIGPDGPRDIPASLFRTGHPAILPLALHLPAPLFVLIAEERLTFPVEASWPLAEEEGIFLFLRSTFGRQLWQAVGGGRPLPERGRMKNLCLAAGMPLPTPNILAQLRLAAVGGAPSRRIPRVVDEELSLWLGVSAPTLRTGSPQKGPGNGEIPEAREALAGEIERSVFVDGLPRFPEHYLYNYFRVPLQEYRFQPPLTVTAEFFGQLTLCDATGNIYQVEGEQTARALRLAATAGDSPITLSLPKDPAITLAILERYLADLRRLRRELIRQAHARLTDSDSASRMVDHIWDRNLLPPWPEVAG